MIERTGRFGGGGGGRGERGGEGGTSRAGIISEGVDAEKERASASDVRINVRVYAMFAGCIISRSGTASKYGRRLAEVRSKP